MRLATTGAGTFVLATVACSVIPAEAADIGAADVTPVFHPAEARVLS